MTTVTAQVLQKLRQKSWEGTPEEEGLEATWENRHRGCGRDMLRQTVPSIYRQQQQERPDRRRWTAVYDGHSATVEADRRRPRAPKSAA